MRDTFDTDLRDYQNREGELFECEICEEEFLGDEIIEIPPSDGIIGNCQKEHICSCCKENLLTVNDNPYELDPEYLESIIERIYPRVNQSKAA